MPEEGKYPYTSAPNSLRKFLKGIPDRANPKKVTQQYLATINLKTVNDRSIIAVLKSVGLIDSSGVPTADYAAVKDTLNGPARLATLIRKTYDDLYSTYDNAQSRTDDELTNFFRVESKLGPKAVQYMLATFKVLCEFADFKTVGVTPVLKAGQLTAQGMTQAQNFSGLHVTIELHLPESKDPSIYESIFQALARNLMKER